MTREEAIRVLEAEKKFLFHGSLSDKHYEPAFDMAIEALSEPRGDLISRADAIQTFIRWGQKEFGFSDLNREERFIDAINALPSALAELVRCKDCRWCQNDYMGTWCGRFSGVRFTNADDFCSHGERRKP